ncbi:hypothetical protein, partial [Clostridium sp. HBUAS56017]|uniref:hypothetical protein n=1 Tax=Clostridium sp. HBUAS56017 TaxID=2571128 RepID=UPI001A9AE24F
MLKKLKKLLITTSLLVFLIPTTAFAFEQTGYFNKYTDYATGSLNNVTGYTAMEGMCIDRVT